MEAKNRNLKWEYFVIGILAIFVILMLISVLTSKNSEKSEFTKITAEIKDQPLQKVAPQGTITFCLRLNGREDMHLPALLGADGDNIYPNGLAGYNWSLTATSTGDEPYGVLEDGTIFVKIDFLANWSPNKVEIKSDLTGWSPRELTLSKVKGEKAYIFK